MICLIKNNTVTFVNTFLPKPPLVILEFNSVIPNLSRFSLKYIINSSRLFLYELDTLGYHFFLYVMLITFVFFLMGFS